MKKINFIEEKEKARILHEWLIFDLDEVVRSSKEFKDYFENLPEYHSNDWKDNFKAAMWLISKWAFNDASHVEEIIITGDSLTIKKCWMAND